MGGKKPEGEKPEGEKPENERPENDKPKDEKPKDEKPKDEKPADEKPKDEKPADENPEVTKKPAVKNCIRSCVGRTFRWNNPSCAVCEGVSCSYRPSWFSCVQIN